MPPASPPESIPEVTAADLRIQEEAALWFARLRGDEVSAAQRDAFAAWTAADARHRREYEILERLWNASARINPPSPKRRRASRVAAGLALVVLACGWLGWGWFNGRVMTDAGERRHLLLADGTELDVAPATRLRLRFDDDLRRIELDAGRIAVVVAPDRLRPFEVAAGDGLIRDIGTRFEVDMGTPHTRVTVAEGMVDVSVPMSGALPSRVGAGEAVEFDGQGVSPVRPTDAVAALAWTKGQLVFDGVPLADVVATLNRYRKTPIELTHGSLAGIRISGVFILGDEEAALAALERIAPVRFIRDSASVKGIRIGSDGRLAHEGRR